MFEEQGNVEMEGVWSRRGVFKLCVEEPEVSIRPLQRCWGEKNSQPSCHVTQSGSHFICFNMLAFQVQFHLEEEKKGLGKVIKNCYGVYAKAFFSS